MTRIKQYKVLAAALAIGLALCAGVAARAMHREGQARAQMEQLCRGAVLSAMRQTEDMSVSLSKAILSAEGGNTNRYLHQVAVGAAQVHRSLSLLPLPQEVSGQAEKFANQAADYAASLLDRKLTQQDVDQLESLIDACRGYTQALYQAQDTLPLAGRARASVQREEDNGSYDSEVSYPTLIYDGPFSDARRPGTARGLGDRQITREEAMQCARVFVGEERVKSVSPGADMGGDVPCWGVTVQLQDVQLQAAITKQGGKMWMLTPDTASFAQEKSVEECRESARAFLRRNGFEGMQPTYFQVYEGVAVISFAATQGDTLLYPDLIKVQLRMDTAQVVGVETRNYWQNHHPRGALAPVLSLEEAAGAVSSRLQVNQGRLCLIPTDSGERLCYEFQGEYRGNQYLCYIDARTGEQAELLQVMEGSAGLEAV